MYSKVILLWINQKNYSKELNENKDELNTATQNLNGYKKAYNYEKGQVQEANEAVKNQTAQVNEAISKGNANLASFNQFLNSLPVNATSTTT
ncbi:MAG: hypothetical protein ACRCX8_09380 [Sarcina sp.]